MVCTACLLTLAIMLANANISTVSSMGSTQLALALNAKSTTLMYVADHIYVVYGIDSQSGVRGPPGVLEGVPWGPQLNDG